MSITPVPGDPMLYSHFEHQIYARHIWIKIFKNVGGTEDQKSLPIFTNPTVSQIPVQKVSLY